MKKLFASIIGRIKAVFAEFKSEAGITLIEMVIALAIFAILGVVIAPMLMDLPQKARSQAAKQQIQNFGIALDRYSLDNGFYPTSEQGLKALTAKPDSEPQPLNYNEGGYIKTKELPKDPWGREYTYSCPSQDGKDYEIISYGADGQEGGEGKNADIKND